HAIRRVPMSLPVSARHGFGTRGVLIISPNAASSICGRASNVTGPTTSGSSLKRSPSMICGTTSPIAHGHRGGHWRKLLSTWGLRPILDALPGLVGVRAAQHLTVRAHKVVLLGVIGEFGGAEEVAMLLPIGQRHVGTDAQVFHRSDVGKGPVRGV